MKSRSVPFCIVCTVSPKYILKIPDYLLKIFSIFFYVSQKFIFLPLETWLQDEISSVHFIQYPNPKM